MNIVVCASAKSSAGKSSLTILMAQMWRHRHSVAVIDLNQSPQAYEWADALNISAVHWPNVTASELKRSLCRLSADIVLIDVPSVKNALVSSIIEISNLILLPIQPSQWRTRCTEQLEELFPRSIKENQSPPIVAVPYLAHSRQTQAFSDVSTGPFKIHYAPPIHRWIEIERAVSTHADFYEPYPFSKAHKEIHNCSNFILNQLRNQGPVFKVTADINGSDTKPSTEVVKSANTFATESNHHVKYTLRLSNMTHAALRRQAFDENRTISDVIREIIDRHLNSK